MTKAVAFLALLALAGCEKPCTAPTPYVDRVDRNIDANKRCIAAGMEPRWVHDMGTAIGGEIRCYPAKVSP